jgi:predicted Co/Zn/Cd cation transporter (cation efflux family)
MAALALKVSRLLDSPETERYPVGYVAYEPFFILIKGLLLLVLTLAVIGSNIVILVNGGNNLELGYIILYLVAVVIVNWVIFLYIRKQEKQGSSPILELEGKNWKINAMISTGIVFSFVFVFLFEDSFLRNYVQYVDHAVVIIVGLISLPVPYKAVREGLSDLLLIAPDETIKAQVNAVIHRRLKDTSLISWNAIVLKTGRKIWVTLFVNPEQDTVPTDYCDKVREWVSPGIEELSSNYSVDVIVTRELK